MMTEESPKSRRILFWTSIVAGGVCLLLVAGYYGGRMIYMTEEGRDRPGFMLWRDVYKRAIFLEADSKGYRYSDLKETHWMNLRLVGYYSDDILFFQKSDGSLAWSDSFFRVDDGLELEEGCDYYVEVALELGLVFSSSSGMSWAVRENVIRVRALSEETNDE